VLKKGFNNFLGFHYVSFVFSLLFFKLLGKIIDFFFFLVKNLVLLGFFRFVATCLAALKVGFNLFDSTLVGLNDLSHISNILILHLDLGVVIFDSVHKTLTSLGER
jgi:hypothetical protein